MSTRAAARARVPGHSRAERRAPRPRPAEGRRRALLGCGVFALAAAWRFAYLWRLARTPFAASLDADSRTYWAWSDHILRHGLVPPAPFFLAPLYPYTLAAWRALGAGMDQVLAIQAL